LVGVVDESEKMATIAFTRVGSATAPIELVGLERSGGAMRAANTVLG
jgi:hypothetical protein